ncbi:epimerase [Pseudooceanicola sp. C21-150M6]|uniref:epimerase n=1 Tax=Pseudooceanicola sp. C21-150M6 TaxID=3434355 RepID=UPI003D7F8F95
MTAQISKGTALILGPTGKFGRHALNAFADQGWDVIAFDRKKDDLMTEAGRAQIIVMGWHPPDYSSWGKEMPAMHRKVIEAARQSGATVILPGNVYVYGSGTPGPWTGSTPHNARNSLGRIRIEVEQMYRDAGVRTILLRCGDFIDDRPSGNWFDRFITRPVPKAKIAYPGPLDVPHAWAYLPDAARVAAMLADRRADLARFEEVLFPGYTLTGREMAASIGQAIGQPVAAGRMSWLPLWIARPFVPVLRGVFEMRYLWSLPHRLDGARLTELLPGYRDTPQSSAFSAALAHLSARGSGRPGKLQQQRRVTAESGVDL